MQILNTLFPYGLHDPVDYTLAIIGITGLCFTILGGALIFFTREL